MIYTDRPTLEDLLQDANVDVALKQAWQVRWRLYRGFSERTSSANRCGAKVE